MDPILRIVFYLFKKNGFDNEDVTYEAFFENGVAFPKLVAIAFNIDSIPGINKNPVRPLHRTMNNTTALQYLFKNNQLIAKVSPSYGSNQERSALLSLILTRQCFSINAQEIIDKCNIIVQSLGIKYNKKSDMLHGESIIELLHVLTDGKVPIESKITDFNSSMRKAFNLANAPLVIDEDSLAVQNQFTFFIQILILFDYFSAKISKLPTKPVKPAEPTKPVMPVKIPEPTKPITPVKIPEPTKPITPVKIPEPTKPITPVKIPEPTKPVMPVKIPEPTKPITPVKIPEPTKPVMPVKIPEPTKPITPVKIPEPTKPITPVNIPEPTKPVMPLKIQVPTKPVTPSEVKPTMAEGLQPKDNEGPDISISDSKKSQERRDADKRMPHIDKKQKKLPIEDRIYLEELSNQKLLEIINLFSPNHEFKNLNQTIENNYLFDFIQNFLSSNPISFEELSTTISKLPPSIKSNESIINFFKKNDKRFRFLLFNFEIPKYVKTSIISFYTSFFNAYFLKGTKKAIFDRVTTILYTTSKQEMLDENKILTNIDSYADLAYFASGKKVHGRPKRFGKDEDFKKLSIPKFIDSSYLSLCSKCSIIPDICYYQLQFIFNKIDEVGFCIIVESMLRMAKKLRKLTKIASVAAPLIQANRFLLIKHLKNVKEFSQKDYANVTRDADEVGHKRSKSINPKTFNERMYEQELNLTQTVKLWNRVYKKAKLFWNDTKNKNSFDNGIVFEYLSYKSRSNESKNEWLKEKENIQLNLKLKSKDDINIKEIQVAAKNILYKIFYYDESQNKWVFDSNSLIGLTSNNEIKEFNAKAPLILILDSDENDSVSLCSNFTENSYPNIFNEYDDQIYVYALCGYLLFKDNEVIKPIFLNLHVPKKKMTPLNQSDIMLIASKIYSFLSFICDIEIVILNENHFKDQVDFVKTLIKMKSSFYNKTTKIEEKTDVKTQNNSFSSKKRELHLFSPQNSSSESDDDEKGEDKTEEDKKEEDKKEEDKKEQDKKEEDKKEEDKKEEDKKEQDKKEEDNEENYLCFDEDPEFNQNINDLFQNSPISLSEKIYTKKSKTIFLINDAAVQSNEDQNQLVNQSKLIQNIKREIKQELCKFIFINVNNSNTYKAFYDCLIEFSFSNDNSLKTDIIKNLTFIEMFRFTIFYLEVRNDTNWKNKLKTLINQRYAYLEDYYEKQFTYFISFKKISNEVTSIAPFCDNEFNDECSHIINEIFYSNITRKKQNKLADELKLSSEENLDCLTQLINDEYYLSNEDKKNLLDNHIQFLKREYFAIIKKYYPMDFFVTIYSDNIKILEGQIENDISIFSNIKNKYEIENEKDKAEDNKKSKIDDEKRKGTNYVMRESESVREIKVSVLVSKDLKTEIEQDF
ncbi:hypothetical protein M9Y10_038916 [Tritrichomonas musculus]|uniref:Calponin-homology (CH) domain-containing protein n=1 Tax=Tritrichomonas musculus TaxID=1915356 RepID=A0ABR2K9P3_9EUKA